MATSSSARSLASRANAAAEPGFSAIAQDYARHLLEHGYAKVSRVNYQQRLRTVAECLHARGQSLADVKRQGLPAVLRELLPDRELSTITSYRRAIDLWLRSVDRFDRFDRSAPWQRSIDGFVDFLRVYRGIGPSYLESVERTAHAFMAWKFAMQPAVWKDVSITDIWAFAQQQSRGMKPYSANKGLRYLRRFLGFIQLQGLCSQELPAAVPRMAAFAQSVRPQVLTWKQRRQLLTCFARRTAEGRRDYAMTRCMIDLGLRATEVARLRCSNVNWQRKTMTVPGVKNCAGREMPLPAPVFSALRRYVKAGRPAGASDALFLRHPRRSGQPLSQRAIKETMQRAYRRCRFPASWSGTHRLRHTFATRLYRGGANLKQIADLMGHRQLSSTNIYAQTDLASLRRLAQPWPVPL